MRIAARQEPTEPTSAPDGSPEARFLAYARDRDPAVLDALLREHADQAYTLARRLLGSPGLAEDAVQDACVRLLASVDRYRREIPFAAWLGRLVHVAALDQRRRQRRYRGRLDRAARLAVREAAPHEVEEAQLERLRRAVAALPETYRAPLSLHYFGGLDQAAIARALSLRRGTVAVRLTRGIERLRLRLGGGSAAAAVAALDGVAGAPAHAAPTALREALAHLALAPAEAAVGGAAVAAIGGLVAAGLAVAAGAVLSFRPPSADPPAVLAAPVPTATAVAAPAAPAAPDPLAAGAWAQARPGGVPVSAYGQEQIVWADGLGRSLKPDAFRQQAGAALVAYDFAANRWDLVDVGGAFRTGRAPESGDGLRLGWDGSRGALIGFGPTGGISQCEHRLATWWLDPVGRTGRPRGDGARPGPAWLLQESAAAFAPAHDALVLVGVAGTWTYAPGDDRWTRRSPTGDAPPEGLYEPMAAYRDQDRRVWLFGGRLGYGDGQRFPTELHAYDPAADAWTRIATTGTRPPGRQRGGFAYDPLHDVFLLHGGLADRASGDAEAGPLADTWILDPRAAAWTPVRAERSPPAAVPNGRLAFDRDHNAFVLGVPGNDARARGGAYAMQTWLFRWRGDGPQPGFRAPTVAAADERSWQKEPALACGPDGVVRLAWADGGDAAAADSDAFFHVRATVVGADDVVDAVGPTDRALVCQEPALALVGGAPWLAWTQWAPDSENPAVWAKRWDGAAWVGDRVGAGDPAVAAVMQGRARIADVGGIPHVAFLEVDRTPRPVRTTVRVKTWDGRAWTALGAVDHVPGPEGTAPRAASLALAGDGRTPWLAWSEARIDVQDQVAVPAQASVARWDGARWARLPDPAAGEPGERADDVALAVVAGEPILAWTARAGDGPARIRVARWRDGSWRRWPDPSRDAGAWCWRPSLAADPASGAVALAWTEQPRLGAPAVARVARLADAGWSALGGALNREAGASAQDVVVGWSTGAPIAAWAEGAVGRMQRVLVARWTGAGWAGP